MKGIRRIGLLAAVVFALAFAAAGVAFANEVEPVSPERDMKIVQDKEIPEAPAATNPETASMAQKVFADRIQSGKMSSSAVMTAAGNPYALKVYKMTSYETIWNSKGNGMTGEYDSEKNLYFVVSKPMTVKRGMLYLYGHANKANVEFFLFDANGNAVANYATKSANVDGCATIFINKTGTYYLIGAAEAKFVSYMKATNAPIYDYKSATLVNQRTYFTGHATKAVTVTYKFKAVATGAMRVSTDCLSKVTVVTGGKTVGKTLNGKYDPTFGVKKGQIYYLKVAWPATNKDPYAKGTTKLKVVNATWTPAGGKTKATAATLSRGVYKKGLIIAGQNNIGWYKFKPGKTVFKIVFTGGTNDKLVWRVYCNNKPVKSSVFYQYDASHTQTYQGPKDATWYVKVERVNSTSSGRYQLRFL